MKNLKKVLALVLAVVMIMGVVSVASAKTYKDADAEAFKNYADAIDALSSLNILDGFEDGEFKADRTFNRAQAAKIVAIVHNAATNGKIKGQDAISALYSNAQNPFVDCNNSWALPYINYCRITGLADGMTATTYAPKRELTGVQWLKLMLTTLNFDTAKEGYTGTGWDVNVLNRANEVGLTAGLADGWKAIAPITRGEAAQILYNALTKYLVEYGQLVKNNYDTTAKYYKTAFISNEQVAKSGYTLGAKMGISITRATDKFRRPGYSWSYGSWAAFYMDKPVNSYTTAVTMCDILKNDIGIPENKTTPVVLNGWVDGDNEGKDATTVGKNFTDLGTALNYFAVDGYKYAYTANGAVNGITLVHDDHKLCQTDRNRLSYWAHEFGGQGDLTQVFETEDGYVITTIHTFLAKVTNVDKNNKYSHATGETADLDVYLFNSNNEPAYVAMPAVEKGTSNVNFAKNSMVLVTMSLKDTEHKNLVASTARPEPDMWSKAKVVTVAAADSKTGKLTGASGLNVAETVSIDGTKYPANCRFVLGKDNAMKIGNSGNTYTFYFDSYGNVIGCTDPAASSEYVVMDKIYAYSDKGIFTIKADLYDLEGNKLEDVTVAQAGDFEDFKPNTNEAANAGAYEVSIYASKNKTNLVNALYTYSVNDKGAYVLNWTGVTGNTGAYNGTAATDAFLEGYGRWDGTIKHKAGAAYMTFSVNNDNVDVINLSETTRFVCKGVNGKWTSYTGYTALPALTARYIDYVKVAADSSYASIVYLGEVAFAGDSVTGYVANWADFDWSGTYAQITVYVKGEAVVVNVEADPALRTLKPGMYTFATKVDKNEVTYTEVSLATFKKIAAGKANITGQAGDYTSFTVGTNPDVDGTKAVAVTKDTAVYEVSGSTITARDASFIGDKDFVVVYGDHDTRVATEIYVYNNQWNTMTDADIAGEIG